MDDLNPDNTREEIAELKERCRNLEAKLQDLLALLEEPSPSDGYRWERVRDLRAIADTLAPLNGQKYNHE
jgi:hypothetical protein